MRINGISAVNSYSANGLNRNQNNGVRKNDVQFGALVAQTAADSFGPLVQKNVNRFMEYMRNLTMQAVNKSGDATEKLRQLIGSDAANALIKNPEKYTQALDESVTKLSPLSGLGTRGEKIRNTITDTLGMAPTHKADVPLPAIIGKDAEGEIYLTTGINELLHMMQAKLLSPFEQLHWISSKTSDGDAQVLVEGLQKGLIPTDRPAIFSYTDDVGTAGHLDYSKLMERFGELGENSPVKVISRGYEATKDAAAGKLGTFLPNPDGSFAVYEKPSMETLNELLPNENTVLTNIGKTLFTPKGIQDVQSRIPADGLAQPSSLTKMDKGEPKWHVTEGILKPAGKEGALDVIPKGGDFCDVGNGTDFTDTMVKIATGEMTDIFPESLEKQIRQSVKLAEDGLTAALQYGDKVVTLPTTKGKLAAEAAAKLNTTQG